MDTHTFQLTNMHCADCATLIDETLRALPGVRTAHATMRDQKVVVALDPGRTTPETVVAAVTELGFRLRPPPAKPPVRPAEPQVSDAAWLVLAPVLRDRRSFEGVAYKHRNGVPWREVPSAFGPWQTLYAKWARWRADGTWAKLVAAAQRDDLADELAWLASAS